VTQFCRGQTIITSSERNERATSIALFTRHARNFGHARSPCAECTWHDSRRAHTRARARAHVSSVHRFDAHGGDTYPRTQDSAVPLLQMLSNVPFLVPRSLSVSRSPSRADLEACPLLALRNPLAFTKKPTSDRLSGNDRQFPDRRRHAPHDLARSSSIHLSDRSAQY